jgi:L-fuconolactonase
VAGLSGAAWRDLVIEDAIDPDLPIVDAHHHVWDVSPIPGIENYDRDTFFADKTDSGHNIVATVAVDCRTNYRSEGPERLRILGETEYIDALATEANLRGGRVAGACAAIVPTANLLEGAVVGEILDAHLAVSNRVRGIRFMTAFDDSLPRPPGNRPGGLMMRADFREGFVELVKRGMTFDAWVLQTQMDEVADLARAFPDVKIVLDQLGGPFIGGRYAGRASESFAHWRKAIQAVAECDNVVLKVGGLNMHYAGVSAIGKERPRTSLATAEAQRDYIRAGIEAFGPARSMFVSNFPVDMKGISYGVLWNTFKLVTRDFTDGERADMFAGVAMRTYGIDAAFRRASLQ